MTKKWSAKKTKNMVKKSAKAAVAGDMGTVDKLSEEFLESIKEKKNRTTPGEKEAKLIALQRMMFRQVPREFMCKQLNVGDRQLRRMQTELKNRVLGEVKGMNFPQFVGETINFYDEVRAMALMIASSTKIEDNRVKLQAMNQALGAEDSKHRFLSLCGVYKSSTAENFAKNIIAETSGATAAGADVDAVLSTFAHTLMKHGGRLSKEGAFVMPDVPEPIAIEYEDVTVVELPND